MTKQIHTAFVSYITVLTVQGATFANSLSKHSKLTLRSQFKSGRNEIRTNASATCCVVDHHTPTRTANKNSQQAALDLTKIILVQLASELRPPKLL